MNMPYRRVLFGAFVTFVIVAGFGVTGCKKKSNDGSTSSGGGVTTPNPIDSPDPDPTETPDVLTVEKTGAGAGTVTSSPPGIDCGEVCGASFPSDTNVDLLAEPSDRFSEFLGWSGACSGVAGCSVRMAEARNVTANFGRVHKTLSVTKTGNSDGTVTSSPEGIDCGGQCTHSFLLDTVVQLNPTPESVFTEFSRWQGDCTGIGPCAVTLSADRTVSAEFTLIPLDGTFTGVTPQSRPVSFTIQDGGFKDYSAEIRVVGTRCSSVITISSSYNVPRQIIDRQFSIESDNSRFSGQFHSPTAAEGNVHFNDTFCQGSVDLKWSASKTDAVAGIAFTSSVSEGLNVTVHSIEYATGQ